MLYFEEKKLLNVRRNKRLTRRRAGRLREPANVRRVSRHHGDGSQLSEAACRQLIAAADHMIGHDLCRELYRAQLDLKLHLG